MEFNKSRWFCPGIMTKTVPKSLPEGVEVTAVVGSRGGIVVKSSDAVNLKTLSKR